MCRPASDGIQILDAISKGQLGEDQVLIRLINSQKLFPPYTPPEKKDQERSSGRPMLTIADVEKVWAADRRLLDLLPKKIRWQELQFTEDVEPRSSPMFNVITQAGMDLFAESWELLVKFHPDKVDREAFSNPMALPPDWCNSFESAISWRKMHAALFEKDHPTPEQIAMLKSSVLDGNPIIRKLSAQKLLSLAEYKTEDIRVWLSMEKNMEDVAVAIQMVLSSNKDKELFADMEWLFSSDEELSFGALLGFSLKFVASQNAVDALERYQWLLRKQGGASVPLPDVVLRQPGYTYLERLAGKFVAKGIDKAAHNNSFFASLFRASKIYLPPRSN